MNIGTIAVYRKIRIIINDLRNYDMNSEFIFFYRRRIFMMSGLALKVAQSRGDIPVES